MMKIYLKILKDLQKVNILIGLFQMIKNLIFFADKKLKNYFDLIEITFIVRSLKSTKLIFNE